MPSYLENIDLAEISLVDEGANEGADIVLHKRKGEHMSAQSKALKAMMDGGMDEEEARKLLKEMGGMADDEGKKAAEKRADALAKALDAEGYDVSEDGKITKRDAGESLNLHGQTIYKNRVGAETFEIMKAQAAEVAELKKAREAEALAKRADAEIPNLKGTTEVRGAILKAVDAIEDEEMRKAAHQSLKGASEMANLVTKERGFIGNEDDSSPEAQINKMAKDLAAKEGISFYKAYEKVGEQNPDLYRKMRSQ